MPLSEYNENPKCWHHYTIKPDPPQKKAPKVTIILPGKEWKPKIKGGVRASILACNKKIFKKMTLLEIAAKFDCSKASVYNVMKPHGIEYKRIKIGGGKG